ncbi:MAG: peptidoglycan DD-metalloendopeptidase family protein [Gemmatimonadaceae bacterium]|nr:peptidoglycan DD-metalloendopeptidase family protein [Gloeobacterales cyanobacterium ES-bin-141]
MTVRKLLLVGVLLGALSVGVHEAVLAAPSVQSLQIRQQQIESKLSTTRSRKLQLRRQERAARGQLGAIRQNLQVTSNRLQDTRFRLSVSKQRLGLLNRDLKQLQADFAREQRATVERLRFLQQQNPQQWWVLMLASRDLNTLMDRRYQLGKVLARDRQMLATLIEQSQRLRRKRQSVESQKNDISLIAQQLSVRQSQFKQQASSQSDLVQRLSTQRLAYEAAERRLALDSTRVSSLIRNLLASQNSNNGVQGSGRMIQPVSSARMSSKFGMRKHPIFRVSRMHTGVDFAARSGTPIRAADSGTVLFAGWYGGYGRCVIINHGDGLATLYGHASRLFVTTGQSITKGATIAHVGSTGFSTGPHLHFEVRRNGSPINPMPFIR